MIRSTHLTRLESNADLYAYLGHLSTELRLRGRDALSDRLSRARAFASGSASEFLYEAEQAVKDVRLSCSDVLSELEIAQIYRVLSQIRESFDRVGGA